MLLGKDDVILNVAPTYVTDALVRKVNVDRYDDREIIKTSLIESYDRLLEFGRKHLPDKFFLEDTVNKSLRNTSQVRHRRTFREARAPKELFICAPLRYAGGTTFSRGLSPAAETNLLPTA